jgi:hypothetical protein
MTLAGGATDPDSRPLLALLARASRGLAPIGWQDYKADGRHPRRKPRRSG